MARKQKPASKTAPKKAARKTPAKTNAAKPKRAAKTASEGKTRRAKAAPPSARRATAAPKQSTIAIEFLVTGEVPMTLQWPSHWALPQVGLVIDLEREVYRVEGIAVRTGKLASVKSRQVIFGNPGITIHGSPVDAIESDYEDADDEDDNYASASL